MLSQLIRKRRVQKLSVPQRCHGCDICSQESLEFYEYVSFNSPLREQAEIPPACGGACYIERTPTRMMEPPCPLSQTAILDCNFDRTHLFENKFH